MPHTLLSAGDEGKDQDGHALVGAKDDTLSSTCSHQAFAARDRMNDFVKPNEQSSSLLEYSAMARTFVQASAEPSLLELCRAQPKDSEENCTFKNGFVKP